MILCARIFFSLLRFSASQRSERKRWNLLGHTEKVRVVQSTTTYLSPSRGWMRADLKTHGWRGCCPRQEIAIRKRWFPVVDLSLGNSQAIKHQTKKPRL